MRVISQSPRLPRPPDPRCDLAAILSSSSASEPPVLVIASHLSPARCHLSACMSAFTALNGASPKTTTEPDLQPPTPQQQQSSVHDQPLALTLLRSHHQADSPASSKTTWRLHDRPSFHPPNHADVPPSHKRKRSDSSSEPRHHDKDAPRDHSSATASATVQADHRQSDHRQSDHLPCHASSSSRPPRQASNEPQDGAVSASPWSSQQVRDGKEALEPRQRSASPIHAHSDDLAGDATSRAVVHLDHSDCSQTSPDAEDASMGLYGSPYDAADHAQESSMAHHDPKKRKRNFSNRTKTGCMTCRKRKKKCDEHKPECSNCVRGGFVCSGYPSQKGPGWQKPNSKAATVPLESKDPSYVPPGAYSMPQPPTPGTGPPPHQSVKREPLPHYRGQVLRIDPPSGRPLVMPEDDRQPGGPMPAGAPANSPDAKLSSVTHVSGNVFPTPVSANIQPPSFGERVSQDFPRGPPPPPPRDMNRAEPEAPHPPNPLPQINILHPTRTSSPSAHPPSAVSSSSSNANANANAQVAAQLALTHPQYPQRRTQKEEMLSGRHHYPFDKELCLERERCASACWRFNNLTTPPTHGVSPDERARLFLEILQPRDPVRVSPSEASPVTNVGRVGRHVAVETPFTCDYGYNICIGNHVVIGRNCTINDVNEVKIGDNCILGPNVSLFTATLPIDPKKRQGGQGPQLGRAIFIEQDCWIGGGATILPGRTIGQGSTVGAGSIVTKDVPPFTVVAGNPARVLRGIGVAP